MAGGPEPGSIEAAATTINWVGYWGSATFEAQLRPDALAWSGHDVRRFAASGGREFPTEEAIDAEDSPSPFTGAGAAWNVRAAQTPWWVDAQFHTEGPSDDESIPRKLEGWWQVEDYARDRLIEVGEDLTIGELCYVEKLWDDRIRVFKASPPAELGIVRLQRVCDLQLTQQAGAYEGSRWDLLRDVGEGGDDPDEIRVGQKRVLLGGDFGRMKLGGMECIVQGYVEWMDRWTVEIPVKDPKGKNHVIAVVAGQLRPPRMPRDLKPNGHVSLELALRSKALELSFIGDPLTDTENSVQNGMGSESSFLLGAIKHLGGASKEQAFKKPLAVTGRFRLKLRYISRVKPGGRVWTCSEDSMYKYVEVRYISQGDYGLVYRVLRMVDGSKRPEATDEEDPHVVLDVARGSDRAAVIKAYRILARKWHPDKVAEPDRERAIYEFRRVHQAYENLLADPERSSDLMVLKMQHPAPMRQQGRVTIPFSFQTEVRCLTLVSQLRLPNVSKLVEVGPNNEFIVTWPYLPEALMPHNESDGLNQVDRVDLVRKGWADYSRSRRCAQKVIRTMLAIIRHDVMIVDPQQNVIIERESGEPLFIDFGRGETAGSIYTTRIKTYMKKILTLLVRSVCKSSFDIAARFIRDVEECLFEELERWQDEKTRDQKKAVALVGSNTKWQEGVECCREIWNSDSENPFRKMFKEQPGLCPPSRNLRDPRGDLAALPESDDEDGDKAEDQPDDDPEGYLDAEISSLTSVQRLLRQKRAKGRRCKSAPEKPGLQIKIDELLPDGTLGLGLDDCPEDMRGVIIVQINRKSEKYGFDIGDRIIEVNGKVVDDWEEFREAFSAAKRFGKDVVFGVSRFGVELPPEPKVPRCLHCGVPGKHLQKCTTWRPMPEGEDCVFFCTRECQKEAWRKAKAQLASSAG